VVNDEFTGLVYPMPLLASETALARILLEARDDPARRCPSVEKAEAAIDKACRELEVRLDKDQRRAAVTALSSRVCVITGGPGTGKSTTQRVILKALTNCGFKVGMAAPTGRAAKRLSEASDGAAQTVHRLLAWNPSTQEFSYNEENPLEFDWIIVDEFSMVDLRIAASLLRAVAPHACLTIVGDVDQLPSVSAGQVLRDLIESGVLPVVRLQTIHRQKGNSGIIIAAHRINRGEMPLGEEMEGTTGFDVWELERNQEIIQAILDLLRRDLPMRGYDPMLDVQVLAPRRTGDIGVETLNKIIKTAMNPALADGRSTKIRGRSFTIGDRVMQLRNDYQKGVYNGEIGIVSWVGQTDDERPEPTIGVDYSGWEAQYTAQDIDDLDLSWAATIHKSQGCEIPVAIVLCCKAHWNMLSRNLLYTAVTRAKTECIVLGGMDAIQRAVSVAESSRRYTGLKKRLNPEIDLGYAMAARPIAPVPMLPANAPRISRPLFTAPNFRRG
jgi:exodeoxyribonuclease V alpha subunit